MPVVSGGLEPGGAGERGRGAGGGGGVVGGCCSEPAGLPAPGYARASRPLPDLLRWLRGWSRGGGAAAQPPGAWWYCSWGAGGWTRRRRR